MNNLSVTPTGIEVHPTGISKTVTVVVPVGTDNKPGLYDSNDDHQLPTHVSSFVIESITGGTTIDLQLVKDLRIVADFPSRKAGQSFGSQEFDRNFGFDRFLLYNHTDKEVTVELIILRVGTFSLAPEGGGVASHVSIDGTPNVAVPSGVKVTGVEFPDKMTVQGAVTVPDGVKVTGVQFPDKMTVQGAVTVPDGVKVTGVQFPDKMTVQGAVTVPDGVKVTGVQFPDKMTVQGAVTVPDGVKVTGVDFPNKMDVQGVVSLMPGTMINTVFMADAAVAIKGTPEVKLASGTIKVDPVPSPSLCAGGRPTVNKAMAKLISAREKRVSVLIQADISNTNDLWICDASSDHVLCAIIQPGCSFGLDFSGELWAQSANDGQKAYITDLYNP